MKKGQENNAVLVNLLLEIIDNLYQWNAEANKSAKQLTLDMVISHRDLDSINISLPKIDAIRVVHGSAFNISEQLFSDKYPERIEEALKGIKESVLICGHIGEDYDEHFR